MHTYTYMQDRLALYTQIGACSEFSGFRKKDFVFQIQIFIVTASVFEKKLTE